MESDNIKVFLDLEEYETLRDFKKNLESNNTYTLRRGSFSNRYIDYISNDEAFINLTNELNSLENENRDLRGFKLKYVEIEKIKQMNFFQFIRWKNSNNK